MSWFRPAVAALCLLLCTGEGQAAKRVALVTGNGAYTNVGPLEIATWPTSARHTP